MISRIALGLCVVAVAWLTAGAMAVRSVSRIWLRHWAEKRLHGASAALMYLERPHRLLTASNAGTAIVIVIAGAIIGWHTEDEQDTAVLALGGVIAVVILLGQLVPRAMARRWPSRFLTLTMPALRFTEALTAPVLALGRAVMGPGAQPASASETGTVNPARTTMATLIREGELEGIGKREEVAVITGVLEFSERSVGEVMTARADVFAIGDTVPARQAAAQIAESKFSRVPVYHDTLDNVVGMYHAFDFLSLSDEPPRRREVIATPADTKCTDLLFRMLRQRIHLAVVQSSDDKTLGIATLEDILEELVGDIRDEHDEPAARKSQAVPQINAP